MTPARVVGLENRIVKLKGKLTQAEFEKLKSEDHKSLYVKQEDGSYKLDVEGIVHDDEVAGLRNALGDEKADRREARKLLKELLGDGADALKPADAKKLIDAAIAAQKKGGKSKTKETTDDDALESLKEQLTAEFGTERETLTKTAQRYKTKLEKTLLEDRARAAIVEAGGDDETVVALLPHVMGRLKLDEQGDEINVIAMRADGKPMFVGTDAKPAAHVDVVNELKNGKFARSFPASDKGGSGAPPNSGGGSSTIRSKADLKTTKEKSDYIKANGQKAYTALPMKVE
jgi:hypothetical protein